MVRRDWYRTENERTRREDAVTGRKGEERNVTGRREKEKRDKKDGGRQKRESRKQILRMVVAGNAR
jgi:hypothetical protein